MDNKSVHQSQEYCDAVFSPKQNAVEGCHKKMMFYVLYIKFMFGLYNGRYYIMINTQAGMKLIGSDLA